MAQTLSYTAPTSQVTAENLGRPQFKSGNSAGISPYRRIRSSLDELNGNGPVHGLGILDYSALVRRPSPSQGDPKRVLSHPHLEMWKTSRGDISAESSICTSQIPSNFNSNSIAFSSSHIPDIFSAAYDPFATYHEPSTAPVTRNSNENRTPQAFLSSSSHSATFDSTPSNVPDLSSSPGSSCNMSVRSSISCAPLESYSARGSLSGKPSPQEVTQPQYLEKIPAEDTKEWQALEAATSQGRPSPHPSFSAPTFAHLTSAHQLQIATLSQPSFQTASNAFNGTLAANDWSAHLDSTNSQLPSFSTSALSQPQSQSRIQRYHNLSRLGTGPLPRHSPRPSSGGISPAHSSATVHTDISRTRKRRQLTTPKEANHECGICGKLFGRSYNYKAHLETHDPTRVYAHPCTVSGCVKRFVRKTDLVRHQQSVHVKRRDHMCVLCGGGFARKDTLRRHTEDGCAKRFEISSRSMRRASSASHISDSSQLAIHQQNKQNRHSSPSIGPGLLGGGVRAVSPHTGLLGFKASPSPFQSQGRITPPSLRRMGSHQGLNHGSGLGLSVGGGDISMIGNARGSGYGSGYSSALGRSASAGGLTPPTMMMLAGQRSHLGSPQPPDVLSLQASPMLSRNNSYGGQSGGVTTPGRCAGGEYLNGQTATASTYYW